MNTAKHKPNKEGTASMEKSHTSAILKDEYIMLQHFYEDIDEKGLNIKNWSITVALAAIGTGILYHRIVLLVAAAAAVMFWILEAYWRGLSYFFAVRIKEIEKAFADGEEDQAVPLQVYSTWTKTYKEKKDQTFRYMFKFSSLLPHVLIAILSIALYLFGGDWLPK